MYHDLRIHDLDFVQQIYGFSKMHGRWIENSRRPLGSASLSSFLNLESNKITRW